MYRRDNKFFINYGLYMFFFGIYWRWGNAMQKQSKLSIPLSKYSDYGRQLAMWMQMCRWKQHMAVCVRIIELNRNRAEKSSMCHTMFSLLFDIVFQFSLFILVYLPPSFLSLFIFIFLIFLFFTKLNEILPPMNILAFVCLFTWACFPPGWSMATCSGRR